MKNHLFTIFSLSTALVLSAGVSAHEGDHNDINFQRVGYFEDVDTNENGKVSKSEYMDFNSDSKRYDKEWRDDHWAEMIEKFDYNDDDEIEKEEIEEFIDEKLAMVSEKLKGIKFFGDFEFDFEGLHGFDDGEFALHMEEKMEGVQERIEEAMERLEEMDFGDFGDHHVFTFRSSPRFEINRGNWSVHEDLDANEDGEISEEEFLNARSKLFDRLDENGDGVLDEDEMDDLGFHGNFVFDWNDDEDDD